MLQLLLTIAIVLIVVGIIKGLIKKIVGLIISAVFFGLGVMAWHNGVTTPQQFINMVQEVLPKSGGTVEQPSTKSNGNDNILDKLTGMVNGNSNGTSTQTHTDTSASILTGTETSSTTEGSVQFGATFVMGDLDHLGRATFAHIRVKDAQEPGSNGIKRPDRISVNPAGWSNPNRTNDRTHLVGYQFSGVNNDPRNLVTASAYLNRGVKKSGSDETNPDGMLFYEQQLDDWVRENPDMALDLYVAPNYEGDNLVPTSVTMRWVGIANTGQLIRIPLGGHSTEDGPFGTVTLQNK